MTDPYAAMQDFIRPAQGNGSFGRVAWTFLICEALIIYAPLLVVGLIPSEALIDTFFEGTTAPAVLAQFASFGISGIAIVLLIRHQYNRGFWSLIGPSPAAAVADLWVCAKAVAVILLIQVVLPPWINLAEVAEVKPLPIWLLGLPFAAIAIVIQAGTEELLFRGFLQQQLGALSRNKWVWMGLPSVVFGVSHYFNGWGPSDGLFYAIWATGLGLACADLTARTGSIGAALGLHLSNNLFALTYVGIKDWPATGLMLFLYPYEDPMAYDYSLANFFTWPTLFELLVSLTMILVMWLAARIAVRR